MKFPALKGTALVKIGIGLIAGVVVVVGGFLLVQNVFTKASDSAPRDLIITDITSNSVKVIWTTDQETQGVVEYGSSPTSLNLFSPETQKVKSHSVNITLLSPTTSYYFQIRIGETKYDNGGVPWTFSTKAQQALGLSGAPVASVSGILLTTPTPVQTGIPLDPTNAVKTGAFGPLKGSSLKVSPRVPTQVIALPSPTPTAYIVPTLPGYVCGETDCQKICQKIGYTCSTQDWMRSGCVGKYTLGSCAIAPTITPSPTITPTPTATPTSTPTPTRTPTPTP